MSKAWVSYDVDTKELSGVFWEEPEVNCVAISVDLAESFILGDEKLHSYRINKTGELEKKASENILPTSFWSLQILDGRDSGIEIKIKNNKIFVIGVVGQQNIMIFATIKNDPSWLIESWNLNGRPDEAGLIIIDFINAENYSYYTGYAQ